MEPNRRPQSYTAGERAARALPAHPMSKRGGPPNPGTKLLIAHGATPAVPDKLYFRIGEVAALCRVPSYVLRFCQTEFPQLRPGKSGTGQRLYRRRDVEMALRIKSLLHEDGYTIAGAKSVLAAEASLPPSLRLPLEPTPETDAGGQGNEPASHANAQLKEVREELRALLRLLERRPAAVSRPLLLPQGDPRSGED